MGIHWRYEYWGVGGAQIKGAITQGHNINVVSLRSKPLYFTLALLVVTTSRTQHGLFEDQFWSSHVYVGLETSSNQHCSVASMLCINLTLSLWLLYACFLIKLHVRVM